MYYNVAPTSTHQHTEMYIYIYIFVHALAHTHTLTNTHSHKHMLCHINPHTQSLNNTFLYSEIFLFVLLSSVVVVHAFPSLIKCYYYSHLGHISCI